VSYNAKFLNSLAAIRFKSESLIKLLLKHGAVQMLSVIVHAKLWLSTDGF